MRTNFSKHRPFNLKKSVSALATAIALACSCPSLASVYGPAPYYDNLLINPNGDTGDLSGWTVTSNGGNGWAVDTGYYTDNNEDNGFLTSYDWDIREQLVDLLSLGFTADFLDTQPTIMVSEEFEKIFCADRLFVQIELLDRNRNLIRAWSSGELQHSNTNCDYSGYKEKVSTELAHYGTGVRYIRWRDGGKDSEWWQGHFGPKLQNASLALAPVNLLRNPGELPSWTVNANNNFEVTGPPEARQFRTSYVWGRRQQTIDLLALGFTVVELDSGELPIIAQGTYREMACPDQYYLKVELLDANHAVLSTKDSGVKAHDGACDWTYSLNGETVHHQFIHYPPGVRYIRWEDGGKDTEFWAGHFGAILEAPYLGIINYSPSWPSGNGRILDMDDVLARNWSREYTYTETTNSGSIRPVPPEPTDSQTTPPCDAGCKLDKIKSGLDPQNYLKLWSVERNNAVEFFVSPRVGVSDSEAPNQANQDLLQAVGQTIATGKKLIDITTLDEIEGPWLDTVNNALKTAESNAGLSGGPTVRVYVGFNININTSEWSSRLDHILSNLTRGLVGNTAMTISISGGRRDLSPVDIIGLSWNHAKIVAVDGKEAIVGGHNMGPQYFGETPVFDSSIKITGDSAMAAHRFVDEVWRSGSQPPYVRSWRGGQFSTTLWPPLLASSLLSNVSNSPNGPIQVLSVGQLGTTSYPTPLTTAVLKMANAAERSIYISQQALAHPLSNPYVNVFQVIDSALVGTLALKAIAGVSVKVILSNEDAPHDTTSQIDNLSLLKEIWKEVTLHYAGDTLENRNKFCKNFTVAHLRIDHDSETYPDSDLSFANHSKTILIDKQVFLVGSHNLYPQSPAQLNEFAYVVAAPNAAQKFFDSYWEPVLRYSLTDTAAIGEKECNDKIRPHFLAYVGSPF